MDAIARKLGLSRIEVRRRNLLPGEMPYERPLVALGDMVVLDSGDYEGLLEKAFSRCGWDQLDYSSIWTARDCDHSLIPCSTHSLHWYSVVCRPGLATWAFGKCAGSRPRPTSWNIGYNDRCPTAQKRIHTP
jgi:Molybdopterin-binding domain of aldehyde dehydrogenase